MPKIALYFNIEEGNIHKFLQGAQLDMINNNDGTFAGWETMEEQQECITQLETKLQQAQTRLNFLTGQLLTFAEYDCIGNPINWEAKALAGAGKD